MKYNHTKLFLLICCYVLCPSLTAVHGQAGPSVSRAEYESLAARVAVLEARLNNQMDTLTSDVLQAMPGQGEGQKSLISSVVDAVKQREQQVNFPWMDKAKWVIIREVQSVDRVTEILGKPTLNEPSFCMWVDYVFSY